MSDAECKFNSTTFGALYIILGKKGYISFDLLYIRGNFLKE